MTGFVYAIEAGARIKLGWSKDPIRRLSKIKSDSPFPARLLGVVAGTVDDEKIIHADFSGLRLHGEWFEANSHIYDRVKCWPIQQPARPTSPLRYIRKHVFDVMQVAFAAMTETTQATVSRWESGELEPGRDQLALIRTAATRLGLAWSDRLFFEVPEVPAKAEHSGRAA